jgi:hypothetical protein
MEEAIESISVHIGGMKIDEHNSTWFRLYDELYRKEDERMAYREMSDFTTEPVGSVKTMYLPLLFWFNRHVSQSLQLVSLQYHEVEIIIQFSPFVKGIDMSFDPKPKLVAEYIYLDVFERRVFATSQHSLLVEQLQYFTSPVTVSSEEHAQMHVELPFNHPCKSLIFVFCPNEPGHHGIFTGSEVGLEAAEVYAPMQSARLLLNGVERSELRPGSWHRIVDCFARNRQIPSAGIYSMYFANRPFDSTAPSGSLNLSRLDAVLYFTMKRAHGSRATILDDAENTVDSAKKLTMVRIFAQSWNQLNIVSGMGGLKWSN